MPSTIDKLAELLQKRFESTENDLTSKMRYLKTQATQGQTKFNVDVAAQGDKVDIYLKHHTLSRFRAWAHAGSSPKG